MKAKELAKKLLKYPDFDVKISIGKKDRSNYGVVNVIMFTVVFGDDIGHSGEVVILSGEEH